MTATSYWEVQKLKQCHATLLHAIVGHKISLTKPISLCFAGRMKARTRVHRDQKIRHELKLPSWTTRLLLLAKGVC
jgi:hypothetical protein